MGKMCENVKRRQDVACHARDTLLPAPSPPSLFPPLPNWPCWLLLFAVWVRFVGLGNNLKLFKLKLLVAVVAAASAPCSVAAATAADAVAAVCCCRFTVSRAVF